MRHGSIATRLARATAADVAENPSGIAEITSRGEKYTQHMIETDILRALTGESGPALFPNIRGAVKDLMSAAKMSQWNASGHVTLGEEWDPTKLYTSADQGPAAQPVPGLTTSYSQTPSDSFDWGKIASSVISAGATIGTALYTSKIAQDTAKKQQQLAIQVGSAQQAAAQAQGQVAQAGILGGSGGTILLIGGIAILGIGAFMALSGGGKKSGRRRRR